MPVAPDFGAGKLWHTGIRIASDRRARAKIFAPITL